MLTEVTIQFIQGLSTEKLTAYIYGNDVTVPGMDHRTIESIATAKRELLRRMDAAPIAGSTVQTHVEVPAPDAQPVTSKVPVPEPVVSNDWWSGFANPYMDSAQPAVNHVKDVNTDGAIDPVKHAETRGKVSAIDPSIIESNYKLFDPLRAIRPWFFVFSLALLLASAMSLGYTSAMESLVFDSKMDNFYRDLDRMGNSVGNDSTIRSGDKYAGESRGRFIDNFLDFTFRYFILFIMIKAPLIWLYGTTLPSRATKAFYLRAFRNDPSTFVNRKYISRTLRKYGLRLSGIQDPHVRMLPFLKGLNILYYMTRYSTPKYMDLEAGDDWKVRLWASLRSAECAFIDVSVLTQYVVEEIKLATACLGSDRILFITDSSWILKNLETKLSCYVQGQPLNIVEWNGDVETSKEFQERIESFLSRLPNHRPAFNATDFNLVRESAGNLDRLKSYETDFCLGVLAGLFGALAIYTLPAIHGWGNSIYVIETVFGLWIFYGIIRHLIEQ